MEKNFLCPHCKAQLSNKKGIMLKVLNLNNSTKGEITFSKILGDYTKNISPDLKLKDGDNLCFQCPHCEITLNLEKDPSKAALAMNEEEKESRIIFSSVVGEQVTYKFSPDGKKKKVYGDASRVFAVDLWEKYTQ